MDTNLHFSSKTGDWSTPQDLYDKLDAVHHFQLDPCATDENAKCDEYYTLEEDGLKQDWFPYKSVFMNPPYSRKIKDWVRKAWEESLRGCKVVCLLPARTDTSWFQTYIAPYAIGEINARQDHVWAAGIIDGEGCIFIRKNKPSPKSKQVSVIHDLGLKVTMTCEKTIRKLYSIFACGYIRKTSLPHRKTAWHWVCRADGAAKVLSLIYPFSVTKKHEVFEGIKFQTEKYKGQRGRKRLPKEEVAKREAVYKLMRNLKHNCSNHTVLNVAITFIRGRLKFGGATNNAPFPSMIVIFDGL